ncbi:hypothetical protein BT69DRAFT_1363894, partial [Atractiella rhizophila]
MAGYAPVVAGNYVTESPRARVVFVTGTNTHEMFVAAVQLSLNVTTAKAEEIVAAYENDASLQGASYTTMLGYFSGDTTFLASTRFLASHFVQTQSVFSYLFSQPPPGPFHDTAGAYLSDLHWPFATWPTDQCSHAYAYTYGIANLTRPRHETSRPDGETQTPETAVTCISNLGDTQFFSFLWLLSEFPDVCDHLNEAIKNCRKSCPAKRKRFSYLDTDGEKDERNEDEGSEEMETEDGERLDLDMAITRGRKSEAKKMQARSAPPPVAKKIRVAQMDRKACAAHKHQPRRGKKSVPQMHAEMDASGPPPDASDVNGDEETTRRKPKANPNMGMLDPYPNGTENNRSKYQCKLGCGAVYSFFGCEYSNLNKHTHTCKKRGKAEELDIKLPEQPPRMRNPDGDPNAFNSFSTLKKRTREESLDKVEEDGFKELIGFLDETVKVYGTTTTRTWGLPTSLCVEGAGATRDR